MTDDGIIELDSERGKPFGLTSENFESGTYYWRVDDSVYVSFVHSKAPGAFRRSVEAILTAGLTVKLVGCKRLCLKTATGTQLRSFWTKIAMFG